MIAILLALSLSPPGEAPLPPPATRPVAVQASSSPASAGQTASEAELAELHAMFERSCGQRAYATFDQVCEALGDQIKTVEREAERAKHTPKMTGKKDGS